MPFPPAVFTHLEPGEKKMAPRLEASSFVEKVDLITLKKNQNKTNPSSSVLVYEFMCVSVHPVLRRERHFVEVAAVVAAFARLDEHGRPLEALAVRADEGHGYRARATWRAAPSVRTQTAVVGPVEADAHTLSVGQADGLRGFLGRGALFPSLGWHRQAVARPYGADSRLLLQLALRVFIGDARRNTHPTAAGALGPLGGLDWTLLLLQVVPCRQVFVAMFTLPAAGLDIYKLIVAH